MIIISATHNHLPLIASCHIKAFPDSLTTKFGHNFVTQMLQWYLSGDNKFLFWIEEDGKCIGYCGGHVMNGTDAFGAGSGMTQFGFTAATQAFIQKPWLLFHPEVLKKYAFIVRNIKHQIKKRLGIAEKVTPVQQRKPAGEWEAGLVVIGVLPARQGLGIGRALLIEFDQRAIQLGAKSVSLSVRKKNAGAIKSYSLHGYHITQETETSYIMKKQIV